ncbi:MAG: rubrerythrin family protein [archaeon]|nr:MAG: rubrerythrin family protein [archaeon]
MEQTLKNLMKAFIGESQARNRYTFYAREAQKEGFEQIAQIFLETAENEREHAKWLFRLINDIKKKLGEEKFEEIKVEALAPTILGGTKENLKSAIKGENYENTTMYPEFAEQTEKDGLPEIASRLKAIAIAEKNHEETYKDLLQKVEFGTVFKKDQKISWVCKKCGYVHFGTEPPEKCPSCSHPRNYFQIKSANY